MLVQVSVNPSPRNVCSYDTDHMMISYLLLNEGISSLWENLPYLQTCIPRQHAFPGGRRFRVALEVCLVVRLIEIENYLWQSYTFFFIYMDGPLRGFGIRLTQCVSPEIPSLHCEGGKSDWEKKALYCGVLRRLFCLLREIKNKEIYYYNSTN